MRVFCLFGDERVKRSKSPLMHNRAFAKRNLDAKYVSFCVQTVAIEKAMTGFRAMQFAGANVTIPHKENVISSLDELSTTSERLGAVNTVLTKAGKLYGENTDVGGFVDSLSLLNLAVTNKNCLVIGTGGAAKGIVMALGNMGASTVFIAGRDIRKAINISSRIPAEAIGMDKVADVSKKVFLIVNATSVSAPNEVDTTIRTITNSLNRAEVEFIFDINYGRPENIWENLANRNRCGFSDGLTMLAAQASRSFNLWTGESATPLEFLSYLGK